MKDSTMRIMLAMSSAMLFLSTAHAADVDALTKQMRCNACHDAEKSLIGPPWQAIAARYQADKSKSLDMLARKIITGGGGTWGVVPMVPNEHVSEADARAMAEWILGLPAPK